MASQRTAFVTGGSGFVGQALIASLLSDGWQVNALARSPASSRRVADAGANPVNGSLGDRRAIRSGASGCSLAFHSAALASDWGDRAEFEKTNVEGTANALAGCAEAGVRRFVHVGTEAALLRGKPLRQIDESAPLAPGSAADYSATKARAEELVRATNRPGFETLVVRPRLIWGPGDETVLPGLIEAVSNDRFAWIDGGGHETSTTHIDNVVHGLRLAAARGLPGEVYFVTDGDPVVFREFITDLLATQGVEPPTRNLAGPLAKAVTWIGEGLWRRLPLSGRPPLTRLGLWLASLETTINIAKARTQLGYEPLITVAEGLAELRGESLEPEPEIEPEPVPEPEPEPQHEPEAEPQSDPEPESVSESKPEPETEVQALDLGEESSDPQTREWSVESAEETLIINPPPDAHPFTRPPGDTDDLDPGGESA